MPVTPLQYRSPVRCQRVYCAMMAVVAPREVKIAVVASAVSVLLSISGAIWMIAASGSLAADAYDRDSKVAEHSFRLFFVGLGIVTLAVAVVAGVATWALWRGRRWAWWVLVVLSAFGCLAALRPQSAWTAVTAAPALIALVALVLPGSRAYVRPTR